MYLTSAIDERYLRADALCVTHHNPKTASEQLRLMGAIYANAVVTIIATDGDAGSGISGLKGISDPRGLSQNVISFGDERLITRNTFSLDEISSFQLDFRLTIREHSLCWRASGTKGLQRRIASSRPIESRFEYFHLPSWSWLGCKGSVHDCSQTGIRVGSNYTCEEEYVEEAFPITEWYTSSSPTNPREQRRRIRPTWFENREEYKDLSKPMPPGWNRLLAPTSEPRIYPDGCSKYLFQHESMLQTYGRRSEWYYPFPVSEIKESTPPFMPEQTPYLFCETAQARLSGYQQDSDKLYFLWDNEAKLCDRDRLGKVIGKLHLPNEEMRDRFPENANGYMRLRASGDTTTDF
ncbi:heterokaryon incompatibility [Fusarium agapanthi]|uniref:Heterokaryon incompatibility n=1 Tax=Fusarium agapanthi TaxID=1803897 RepID=A0A9P5EBZ2_9HYPO|nr:heterokaryon incompatibility [Fusarium agapanthi]